VYFAVQIRTALQEFKMPKAAKHSAVAEELKKEYLREHLDSVKSLIRDWISALAAAEPLAREDREWGWQCARRLPFHGCADEIHVLRRHMKSRALWSHCSDLELKLEETWQLSEAARSMAATRHNKTSRKSERIYTLDYLPLALWEAFNVADGKKISLAFKAPGDSNGLNHCGYKIEESATTQKVRADVEAEFCELVSDFSGTPAIKSLVNSWKEVRRMEGQILGIANNILKSNDIFYPCRFCRHLWS
jgi:hypothetical protein